VSEGTEDVDWSNARPLAFYLELRKTALKRSRNLHGGTSTCGAARQRAEPVWIDLLKNLGLNIIEYSQSAAFNTAESVVVDVSRADRGKES
jgi:hypothetical protein